MSRFISVILTIMLIITCINPCSAHAQIAVEVLDEAGPFIIEDAQIIGSTIVVGGVAIYEIVKRSTEPFGTLLQPYLIVRLDERDYNDAKDKGLPVPGKEKNEETTGHGMNLKWNTPYSSQQLFADDVDKQNGCPKQIRYYGKDGKAELDIDFSHTPAWVNGKLQTFPHKQRWVNGVRSDNHEYDGIDKIIDNWKCKNYDFKTHTFKKGGL